MVVVRFLDEFERVAGMLTRDLGLGTPAGAERASFPLHRFPYTLIYRLNSGGIRVLVVRHQHRDPQFGEDRSCSPL
jgi:toxin ParE1/3/4